MRAALSIVVRQGDERSPELEAALRDYVASLKASGALPEEVILAIKGALQKTGLLGPETFASDSFVDGVVTYCIKQFYGS